MSGAVAPTVQLGQKGQQTLYTVATTGPKSVFFAKESFLISNSHSLCFTQE